MLMGIAAATLFALGSAFGARVNTGSAVLQAAPAGKCGGLPDGSALRGFLLGAPAHGGDAGGLFHGTRMWGAVVNRDGELCATATNQSDPTQVWPGSQAIAKAKA